MESKDESNSSIVRSVLVNWQGLQQRDTGDLENIFTSKCEDYTVTVVIWQAKQLAGLEINPYVNIQIGNSEKKTKTKKGQNDAVFEETFVFNFHQPPAVFFEQMFTLEAVTVGGLLRRSKTIGSFKIDLATVFEQPDHMFFHRWAVLIDTRQPQSGPKGYICCDVMVATKGTVVKMPSSDEIDDDIEANLLVPDEIAENTGDQVPARYVVSIHSGEDLPNLKGAAFASVRKAVTGKEPEDLIDAFVQVSFAGQTGTTRVKKDTCSPKWSEQIIFTEFFPPLVRSMRIHVRDDSGSVVATTFLDLNNICDNGHDGFVPTFGPSYLNLYGAYRGQKEITPLNFGLGEGVNYRGRILVSLRVELDDYIGKKGMTRVEVKNCLPLPENIAGSPEEYFLFTCILGANMIDKRMAGRPLSFELSIGNNGTSDLEIVRSGSPEPTGKLSRPQSISTLEMSSIGGENAASSIQNVDEFPLEGPRWYNKTTPMKASAKDDYYCYIPYGSRKPCMSIYSLWEDQRLRLFHSNFLKKMYESFDTFVTDVARLTEMEQFKEATKRLKMGLDMLSSNLNEYLSYLMGTPVDVDSPFGTPLDREKHAQRVRVTQDIINKIAEIRKDIDPKTLMTGSSCLQCLEFVNKIKHISLEPQEALPDIYLWLVSGNRRLAYHRFKAADLLYSDKEEEKGKFCGKRHAFFLKIPGMVETSEESYEVRGHITAYMWLGLSKEMATYLSDLPGGYVQSVKNRDPTSYTYVPPQWINYREVHIFELRCHIYQGRALMPADESGLSDPFVRVLFMGNSLQTQVLDQTVNPLWDECLILPAIKLYGVPADTLRNPPKIIMQVYDQDPDGSNEFLGHSEVLPSVKLGKQKYERPRFPPLLNWIPVYKDRYRVGEILACFELIQLTPEMRDYPGLPQQKPAAVGSEIRMPIPDSIRPKLAPYRIEALFFGLRQLKYPGMLSVDKPKVEIEVAGHVLKSDIIPNYKKQQNFTNLVKIIDVMLPENPYYRPPMSIRVVDSRSFGRSVLIGTHVIDNIDAYLYTSEKEQVESVAVEIDEKQSLLEGYDNLTLTELGENEEKSESTGWSSKATEKTPSVDQHGYFVTTVEPMGGIENEAFEDEEEEGRDEVDAFPTLPFPPLQPADQQLLEGESISLHTVTIDDTMSVVSVKSSARSKVNDDRRSITSRSTMKNGSIASQVTVISKAPKSEIGLTTIDEEAEEKEDTEEKERPKSQEKQTSAPQGENTSAGLVMSIADENQKQKKKKKEPEIVLDWWSKYYASVQDLEEEQKKSRLRFKKVKEVKTSKKAMKAMKHGIFKVVDKAYDLKDKVKKEKPVVNAMPVKQSGVSTDVDKSLIERLNIYPRELESEVEFASFSDYLHVFKLYRGKKTFSALDELKRYVGTFKGDLHIQKLPLGCQMLVTQIDHPSEDLITFPKLPEPAVQNVTVRVYVVKANQLKPADSSGKADPYLVVLMGKNKAKDSKNRINNQLNPIFGRFFEFDAKFPADSELCIQVWDYDRLSAHDLMGETKIDLEQRWYSKHRATCGLPNKYETKGYCAWTDIEKPSQILAGLCTKHELSGPIYKTNTVTVEGHVFTAPKDKNEEGLPVTPNRENVALYALNHWSEIEKVGCVLVPEHVESRHLYLPELPGTVQGTLDMFVQIFPKNENDSPGLPIDIKPRKPKTYELRVTIWDTKKIPLDDVGIIGGDSVDQYIKGYIFGPEDDVQQTDVHFRSLNGSGNFNWRFVYRFEYLDAEEKISLKSKQSWYSLVEHEEKIAPKLNLEVWDADTFSGDDYLGRLSLDMTRLPRGAKNYRGCCLKMMDPTGDTPRFNLFRQKRIRGWWPFTQVLESGDSELAGMVDCELQMMSIEEAEERPVGLGREPPEPLPEPNRPETSFAWFSNPLMFLQHSLWNQIKYKCVIFLIVLLVFFFIATFIYTFPEAVAQRMVLGSS